MIGGSRAAVAAIAVVMATAACEGGYPDVIPYRALELPEDVPDEETNVTREQLSLEPSFLEVPDRVPLGGILRYVVALENTSDEPVSLDPCPVYYQAWGESSVGVSRTSHLNCDEAPGEIAPGESVEFEMQLPLTDVDPIEGGIVWYLGGPDADVRGDVSLADGVEVVAPAASGSPGAGTS